ncbi:hypothetical protein [Senegalia massiliensis]|jgi:hypothetical protein|uniref:hypothetical protein n=1 Tax=Senegalia massiliensis TaxID=1720316 RepID=UPI0013EF053D|nr:hypothetical protein [Senegalia massiliensis]
MNNIEVILNIEDEEKYKEIFTEALAEFIIGKINSLPSNHRMKMYNDLLEQLTVNN